MKIFSESNPERYYCLIGSSEYLLQVDEDDNCDLTKTHYSKNTVKSPAKTLWEGFIEDFAFEFAGYDPQTGHIDLEVAFNNYLVQRVYENEN